MYSTALAKKAESGCSDAMIALSHSYLNGDGVEPNADEALKWIEKAAKNGNPTAQHEYAEFLYHLKQHANAFYWMKLSAENGHKKAKASLAIFYFNGIGTGQNTDNGLLWLQQVADDGKKNK